LTATAPAFAIATDPVAAFAYGASSAANQLNAYAIDSSTGTLSAIAGATYFSGMVQVGIAIDAAGRWVMTADEGSNNVSVFAIASDGTLSEVPGSPFEAGTNPWAVAVDPQGKYAFVANAGSNNVSVYAIDPTSGALTPAPGSPFATAGGHPQSLAVHPSGNFLYVGDFSTSDISVFAITRSSGGLSLVGSAQLSGALAVAVEPTGHYAYGATGVGVEIYAIDSAAGTLTDLGAASVPLNSRAAALALNPAGTRLFVLDTNEDAVNAYTLDSSDGSLALVTGSPFADVPGKQGLGSNALAVWN
jgi:6-phosphogluconolactonase